MFNHQHTTGYDITFFSRLHSKTLNTLHTYTTSPSLPLDTHIYTPTLSLIHIINKHYIN